MLPGVRAVSRSTALVGGAVNGITARHAKNISNALEQEECIALPRGANSHAERRTRRRLPRALFPGFGPANGDQATA
jgi:hypothetical protein